jgi:hypothetical protein
LITGIQLEKGSVGTGFDFRPFGTELQLCQRYFEKSFEVGTVPADTVGILTDRRQGVAFGSTSVGYQQEYKVSKRTAPSMTLYKGLNGGTNGRWGYYDNSTWVASTGATITNSENEFRIDFVVSGRTFGQALILDGNWTASAEL